MTLDLVECEARLSGLRTGVEGLVLNFKTRARNSRPC